jgi:hypothetical protein
MSAEVERVFCSARRLVTADRNRLQDTTIEMLALLKYWWSNGILEQEGGRRQPNQHQAQGRYCLIGKGLVAQQCNYFATEGGSGCATGLGCGS